MHKEETEDTRDYTVVQNHEEQYSIWLSGRELPAGWVSVGKSGPKAECLQYIDEVWTDMRPLSLRRHMEAWANGEAPTAASAIHPHKDEVFGSHVGASQNGSASVTTDTH